MDSKTQTLVYGLNPVTEAVRSGNRKCFKIFVQEGKNGPKIRSLLTLSRSLKIRVETLPRDWFQRKFRAVSHQGIVGYFSVKETLELPDLIGLAFTETPQPTLILLDGVQDPQNLGAIIRSAEAFKTQGLILPRRGTAPLNETVSKCSAGALENLPVAWTSNLAAALKNLKEAGFWVVGVEPGGEKPCYEFEFKMPVALVLGGEEKGIRRLVRESCDFTVSIPMPGTLKSLNVSAASAVLCYEILRQKTVTQSA